MLIRWFCNSIKCIHVSVRSPHRRNRIISHVVYHSSKPLNYWALCRINDDFFEADAIETKNAGLFNDLNVPGASVDSLELRKLKKFIFNYCGESQMKNLNKVSKGSNIQLVSIFLKFSH